MHFTKLRSSQLAEVNSVLKNRPRHSISSTLSPEAREAMQQVKEEAKIEEAAKRGKRGSRGNVLFAERVQVRQEVPSPIPGRRPSYADVFSPARRDDADRRTPSDQHGRGQSRGSPSGPESPRRYHGRRRSSVSRWVSERPVSVTRGGSEADEVDQVLSANLALGQ